MSRMAQGIVAALLVLAADQASKYWIVNGLDLPGLGTVAVLPFFSLTFVRNTGVTFGLLGGLGAAGAWVLAIVALAVVVGLFLWLRRAENRIVATALGMIAGGAVGNVMDRLRFGWVVDFLDAHAFGYRWYVFNVADAAIVCGVAVLLLDGLARKPANAVLAEPADRG